MKILGLALILTASLCGCVSANTPMGETVPTQDSARFTVTRVGVFEDSLAYDMRRGIYVIHDKQTGTDYVGISGVGISELGSHMSGKILIPDER